MVSVEKLLCVYCVVDLDHATDLHDFLVSYLRTLYVTFSGPDSQSLQSLDTPAMLLYPIVH